MAGMSDFMCNNSDSFLVTFKKARKKMHNFLEKRIKEYNLTSNQIDVLIFIKRNKEYNTAKDIVEYIGVSKGLVSRSIDDLLKRGYITACEDKNDKRKLRLFLTDEGEKIVNIIEGYDREFFEMLTSNITKEEMEVHSSIINKIVTNLKNID